MATETQNKQDTVEVFIERASGNDDPNLLVGINGVNYILPKGQTSKVPKFVADEIKRSRKAQLAQDKNIDQMKDKAQQPK